MEWKRARISQERQVTIPQKLFDQAGIKDEVEFGIKGNTILMRPVQEKIGNDYFADLILADLIREGWSGDELLTKFREKQAEFHIAIRSLISDSERAAQTFKETEVDKTKELFNDVMED